MEHDNILRADMFFEDVDSYMIRLLKDKTEYQELKKKWEELWQKYPFINSLYDSTESMSLTEEQHKVLLNEMELSLAIRQYERREYFWIGQQYVLEYLAWMKERGMCHRREESQNKGQSGAENSE